MNFLFILGREPKLSLAELESIFGTKNLKQIAENLAKVTTNKIPDLNRLGGSLKCAQILDKKALDYLASLPDGKITLGFSDYSPSANPKKSWNTAMKFKKLLARHGRSVRLVPNSGSAVISSAAAHHNRLGIKTNHVEIIQYKDIFATSIGTQNITAYAKRDQARPARDAFVGMLPPKLAQILINLATGPAEKGLLLDPFCGTGVVLQETLLDGLSAYGTDLSEKMISYSQKNLDWLHTRSKKDFTLEAGDATTHKWDHKIDFVASEIYLGHPLSSPPTEIKLKQLKSEAKSLLLGFLSNILPQITSNTPLALAIPAWSRPNGSYSTLNILDEIKNLGYNVVQYKYASSEELLYYREGQIVARQIIVLRKK